MRPQTIRREEEQALRKPESQDSQGVLHKYVQEFGIGAAGATSFSPTAESHESQSQARARPGKTSVRTRSGSQRRPLQTIPPDDSADARTALSQPRGVHSAADINNTKDSPIPTLPSSLRAAFDGDSSENVKEPELELDSKHEVVLELAFDQHGLEPKKPTAKRHGIAKMDTSQSPTQSNDDRDYITACHTEAEAEAETEPDAMLSSLHDNDTARPDEPRTLLDDDTGAVNFGTLSQDHVDGPDSHSSDIISPVRDGDALMARGSWRDRRQSQKQSSCKVGTSPAMSAVKAPETPAAAANPFGARPPPSVFRATQMFNQATQFSSAVKKFSPTSSRPSPNNFHAHTFPNTTPMAGLATSPLNGLNMASSPIVAGNEALEVDLSTPSLQKERTHPPYRPLSSSGQDLITESPSGHADLSRRRTEPLQKYEPVATSQERKSSVCGFEEASSQDSGDEERWRQQRAKKRREEAEKQLNQISVQLANKAPSSPQGRRKNGRGAFRRKRQKESFAADEQDKGVIPDSQPRQPSPDLSSEAGRELVGLGVLSSSRLPEKLDQGVQTGTDPKSRTSTDVNIPETSPARLLRRRRSIRGVSSSLRDDGSTPGDTGATQQAPETVNDEPPTSGGVLSDMYPDEAIATLPERKSFTVNTAEQDGNPASGTAHVLASLHSGSQLVDAAASGDDAGMGPEDAPSSTPQYSPPTDARRSMSRAGVDVSETPIASPIRERSPEGPQPPRRSISTSSLSALSSTPSVTSAASTSPMTDPFESPHEAGMGKKSPTSSATELPIPGKAHAKLARPKLKPKRPSIPKPSLRTSRKTRAEAKSLRQQILREPPSTDELMGTPAPSDCGFENSMVQSKMTTTRSGRQGDGTAQCAARSGRGLLFSNMSFAISLQARQAGEREMEYKNRCELSIELGQLIANEGGRVLSTGFNELFDLNSLDCTPDRTCAADNNGIPVCSSLALRRDSHSLGFTALIADGHSRKVKYMQALALGLPCLAYQWVTTCLDKGTLVDWAPYLLCAGQSVFLGNAMRSRLLMPYPAADARLVDIFEKRHRLLGNNRILLVMKKSRNEESKMAYVFLARVLGAGLSRVHNVDEARTALREGEEKGCPFDWLYLDDQTATNEELFRDRSGTKPTAKKRKRPRPRPAAKCDAEEPTPKRIRCLSNELVIQSLIMGRLVDEEEWSVMEQ